MCVLQLPASCPVLAHVSLLLLLLLPGWQGLLGMLIGHRLDR
jgi:hypothetical protein